MTQVESLEFDLGGQMMLIADTTSDAMKADGCDSGLSGTMRILKLRLIPVQDDGQGLVTGQSIPNQQAGVTGLWKLAGIDVQFRTIAPVVSSQLYNATTISEFFNILADLYRQQRLPAVTDTYEVDVYVSNTPPTDQGGGNTYPANVLNANSMVALTIMTEQSLLPSGQSGNPWLLAHECGHLLLAKHPPAAFNATSREFADGSWHGAKNSVLTPSNSALVAAQGGHRNPEWNCHHANTSVGPMVRYSDPPIKVCLTPTA
ncbi:MAG: hypothetical protein IPK16_13640 [Anaerolineales bacterium]|nr:hypothetical protein [Anaerolineales bacterium]